MIAAIKEGWARSSAARPYAVGALALLALQTVMPIFFDTLLALGACGLTAVATAKMVRG